MSIAKIATYIGAGILSLLMAALLGLFVLVLQNQPASPPASVVKSPDPKGRPNIVMVMFEDMSPRVGAFGDPVAHTPVLDAFAEEGVRYLNTFTTAGVCSPSRSSLITGVHQQTLGTQHMRTRTPTGGTGGGPIAYDAVPPINVKAFPELLRAEGYYAINSWKTDYQFGEPFTIWDESANGAHWRNRPDGAPFFAAITLLSSHESYTWPRARFPSGLYELVVWMNNMIALWGSETHVHPADVEVPPYLPDTPAVRQDIARVYNNIANTEQQLAALMDELREDRLLDNTVVIVTTDHGDGLPRMKRTVYDSGIQVPMMIRFPDGRGAGTINEELVSFVDFAPTILTLAGANTPDAMQGRDFLGDTPSRTHVFAAADRHDKVTDRYRAVRSHTFKYIRNYEPEAPFFRHLSFRDSQETMQTLWAMHAAGKLSEVQESYFQPNRPGEELYDLIIDPHEVVNLADDPTQNERLASLRRELDDWIARTGDLSAIPEADMIEAMWPGMVQPLTAPPTATINREDGAVNVTLESSTEGASIGFSLYGPESDHWRLYNGPIRLTDEQSLWAKAIRYGYAESTVMEVSSGARDE